MIRRLQLQSQGQKTFFVKEQDSFRENNFKIIFALLIIGIGVFFMSQFFKGKPLQSATSQNLVKKPLQNIVETSLKDTKGTYGVVIKSLKTGKGEGESYYYNGNKTYQAGSLYKLWVMATAFRKIQSGQLQEDLVLSEDIETLNNKFGIDPESVEQKTGAITLTVHDALNQMIVISHNYAALLLTEKIKLSSVATFLKDTGFNQSKVGTDGEAPVTTASDIALFFEKLYKNELASEENTKKMLELLKKQQLNNKIPKMLPTDTIAAHKTGEIGWFSHDAGIIFTPSGNYIIVVLSETDYPLGAEERIAQISKAVYEYFNKSTGTD